MEVVWDLCVGGCVGPAPSIKRSRAFVLRDGACIQQIGGLFKACVRFFFPLQDDVHGSVLVREVYLCLHSPGVDQSNNKPPTR